MAAGFPAKVNWATGEVLTAAGLDDLAGTVNLLAYNSFNAQVGATYTFVLADVAKIVTATNASAQTYSIPTDAVTAFTVGSVIEVISLGAGLVTINAVTPGTTTVVSTGTVAASPVIRKQYSAIQITKLAANSWIVNGDIS